SISFQSLEQLRTFLTPKRIELLRTIRHKEPKSIYELAKIVNRTTENVNTDVKLLKNLGFVKLKKVEENRIKVIPMVSYDKMTLEIDV
ncbi:ArsR family transcriptional regulator, partial [archaeon]|nr:ArsR family transcriptional regulator [archaeon]